jgi:hypothetical protein
LSQSLERIRLYFGWSDDAHMRFGVPQNPYQCKEQYLQEAHINQHHVGHPPAVVGSEEWEVLKKKNWADVKLFQYVSDVLYNEQAAMFPTLSSATETQPQIYKKGSTKFDDKLSFAAKLFPVFKYDFVSMPQHSVGFHHVV